MKWVTIKAFGLTMFLTATAYAAPSIYGAKDARFSIKKNTLQGSVSKDVKKASDLLKGATTMRKLSMHGGSDGGGGNGDVAEFYTLVRLMASAYRSTHSTTALGYEAKNIESLYKKLVVEETTEDLFLKGELVEAINYPSDLKVVFNSATWAKKSQEEKLQLVAHEVLGLLKVEDPKYEVSSAIVLEIMRNEDLNTNILRASQPLKLKNVQCRVWRNYDFSSPYKTFKLVPVAGGLGKRAYLTKEIFVEVSFGYGPRVQNTIELLSVPDANSDPEVIGKIIASTTVNFFGDSIDGQLKTAEWEIDCSSK